MLAEEAEEDRQHNAEKRERHKMEEEENASRSIELEWRKQEEEETEKRKRKRKEADEQDILKKDRERIGLAAKERRIFLPSPPSHPPRHSEAWCDWLHNRSQW